MTRRVDVVLPNDIDDPATPSGGNRYDREVCRGLAALGWRVREHAVGGGWPHPTGSERAGLTQVLASLPDDGLVLVDGMVAAGVPEVLVPHAARLRLVPLVHMRFGEWQPALWPGERDVMLAAEAVVTTSEWSRGCLVAEYGVAEDRARVATPGVEPAPLAPGTADGSRLLSVAAVTHHKGHDLLLDALATLPDLAWTWVCVGSLDRDPGFADYLRGRVRAAGLAGRIDLVGPRTGADLHARYAAADLLALPSRGETYGMVVTEALARGLPVLATAADGVPEALGRTADGSVPGLLVPPEDPIALAAALRRWLTSAELRAELRASACLRRSSLTGWRTTAKLISDALDSVAARTSRDLMR